VMVRWKTPPSISPNNAPRITFTDCSPSRRQPAQPRLTGLEIYTCEKGLLDKSLVIDYPLFNPFIASLLRIEFQSGETRSVILDPGRTEWRIPEPETFTSVIRDYFALGVEHIFGGVDHLLFLAGLLYIARSLRRILVTVTGFTLAHSVTLFLVALDVLRVSIPAVETVIALSIVMLAVEIARNDLHTLTCRHPLLVACGCGLIPGAALASALSETGPAHTLPYHLVKSNFDSRPSGSAGYGRSVKGVVKNGVKKSTQFVEIKNYNREGSHHINAAHKGNQLGSDLADSANASQDDDSCE